MFRHSKFIPYPLLGLEHLIFTGQSLPLGVLGVPFEHSFARGHRYLMFNGGAFGYGSADNPMTLDLKRYHHLVPHRPMISPTYYTQVGETPFMGVREYLYSKGYPDGHRAMLFSNVAQGGRYLWCLNKAGLQITSLTYAAPNASVTTAAPYGGSGNLYLGALWYLEIYNASDARFNGVWPVYGSSGLTFTYNASSQSPGASATGAYVRGPSYGQSLLQMQQAKNLIRPNGYRVGAIFSMHGEGDRSNSDYDVQIRQWSDDYSIDAKAISGQLDDVLMYHTQVSSFTTTPSTANNKMLKEHQQGNKSVLIGPKYFVDHSPLDGIHLIPLSLERMGEYYGRAYYQRSILGQTYDPLFMTSCVHATATNNTVCLFNKKIVKDIINVKEHTALGFVATDASGDVPITNVILNPAIDKNIGFTYSRAVVPPLTIGYATVATGGYGGPSTGPRGNIRAYVESPEIGPLTGYPMYDWACHQEITATII